ncbi:MAG: SRPBCC family protein [Micrococcales bacterium]|nr:SRPBCC family protein [Micrococcales bacterium]
MLIEATAATRADIDTVWGVLADIEAWHTWTPTVTAARQIAREPAAYALWQPRMPPATWTVTDWRPSQGFVWENRRPGILSVAQHWLEPAGGGTRIHLMLEWTGGLTSTTHLLIGKRARGYVTTEAESLAAHCDGLVAD